ncbi:pyridoxamine 5'-phosphate oxidase family protein [Tessaracoccus sp. HDW20]|uniref:pyridoxamine 5'-phosphate oxidase family protein n=1 Tax=Tessaracoccus coleopterorum TaxID=2714950 RepID=UPI0018D464C4|nr:pyridoxamine 5'-phosphate oxidase family protein [Tessaracoccus coleopterorum]NHB85906.1 pyridoxamine 5'-phosphate oxidase family protein [Tessaracoccus coleopterorum]
MTSDPGSEVTYFSRLEADECWALLAEAEMGRIAWQGDDGLVVFPVNFRLDGHTVVFQTADGGALSRLTEPTEVAFQADEIDAEAAVGWTVLIQGSPVRGGREVWPHQLARRRATRLGGYHRRRSQRTRDVRNEKELTHDRAHQHP